MRLRRPALAVLSCAAVALAGCGSSGLLEGDSASELQESLAGVRTAIDDGRCSEARSAARSGSERVDELPDSVDGELRDRLRQGFDELAQRVESDCEERTTTTAPPTTTSEPEEPTLPETTTSTPSTPDIPSTTQQQTPTEPDPDPLEPVDPTDPADPDDGSGGVVPGVDGPGASERSAPGRGNGAGTDLRRRWEDFKDRVRDGLNGQGRG